MWLSPGMLDEFGGLTEVTIYPMCATALQRAAVLAFPVLGQIDAGWQATQLTHKQLKHTDKQIKNTFLYGDNPTP